VGSEDQSLLENGRGSKNGNNSGVLGKDPWKRQGQEKKENGPNPGWAAKLERKKEKKIRYNTLSFTGVRKGGSPNRKTEIFWTECTEPGVLPRRK